MRGDGSGQWLAMLMAGMWLTPEAMECENPWTEYSERRSLLWITDRRVCDIPAIAVLVLLMWEELFIPVLMCEEFAFDFVSWDL
eukprot:140043-Amorphochlora_amoeboformis.AAC.1